MTKLVFSRRFSMAHRLIHGPSEKCKTPHGHNEIVRVTLQVDPKVQRLDGCQNMPVSFHDAKKTWHRFVDDHLDHSLQLSYDDPLLAWFNAYEPQRLAQIVVTPGDPTTELLSCLLMSKVNAFLEAEALPLSCTELSIEETPTNTVSFTGSVEKVVPQLQNENTQWWQRPDMSISNFPQGKGNS